MRCTKTIILFILLMAGTAGCSGSKSGSSALPVQFDKYGGISSVTGNNTSGFFRTQLIDNRWVFVDPDNHAFFSLGANHVSFGADDVPLFGFSTYSHNLLSLYPSSFQQYAAQQWAQETITRYRELGFNTLGNWSDDGITAFHDALPYVVTLGFVGGVEGGFGANNCPSVSSGFSSDFPDVFDTRFTQNAYAYAQQAITQADIQDPWLIGYFIDNELSWFGAAQLIYNPNYTLADDYIRQSSASAGKQYWVNVFLQQERGYTLDDLNRLYGTSFTGWTALLNITSLANNPAYPQRKADKEAFLSDIANTYFSVTDSALKSVDPNHLNLCARFASGAPDQVIVAASRYCDAISVNDYYTADNPASIALLGDPAARWKKFFTLSMTDNTYGKPFIQSEFGTRALDSGLPDTGGAGLTVNMQNDRSDFYTYDTDMLLGIQVNGISFLAGFHWFEWTDEPSTGRFDGENSNYGCVNIKDEPYVTFFNNIANQTHALESALAHNSVRKPGPVDAASWTMNTDGTVTLDWDRVNGAGGYTVIVSPYRSMPGRFTLAFTGVTANSFTIPYVLPQGTWWFDIKAVDTDGVQGDYITPSGFTVTTAGPDVQSCVTGNNLGYFVNDVPDTFPAPDNSMGDGFVMPSPDIKEQGTDSAEITFTLNSLAIKSGMPASTTVSMGMDRTLPLNSSGTLSFDVYPDAVYTPSGAYRSATDFVHIKLIAGGTTLYDSPLPSSLQPYAWSTVGISLSGTSFTQVTPVFYVDGSTPDIPYDQRITFYLDNYLCPR